MISAVAYRIDNRTYSESGSLSLGMISLIIHSAAQLLTIKGNVAKRGTGQGDLCLIQDGAVAISGDEIVAVGTSAEIHARAESDTQLLDASGCVVLPGFVDAHTHVVFAGDRANEYDMRVQGATYLDIMKAGGGIMSTVRSTRAASLEQIVEQSQARLSRMFAYGTTTAEVKTGYGLDTANEIKLLDAIALLEQSQPMDLIPTFLGAHATPVDYKGRQGEYVDLVANEMLPVVKERFAHNWASESSGRVSHAATRLPTPTPLFCDVFCDEGAFTLDEARRVLVRAKEQGFALKIHADEFANLGGATLAGELGAVSADHLMATTRADMQKMADANVIAVLLPGTTFGLGKFDFANGRAFVQENVPVALGSDINPGTSWCESMSMMLAVATRYEKLTPAEAIVAATLNAAYACGVGARVGSIEPGKLADILIADVPDYRHLAYRYGTNPIRTVVKRGQVVI